MSRLLNDIGIRFATLDDAGLLLRLIRELAAYERTPNAVVATGGGSVVREENRRRIWAFGHVVWLTADPDELARRLESEEKEKVLILDVRSHGYYDANAARIKGSIRIEPNNLSEELNTLPKDKDIYVYCT